MAARIIDRGRGPEVLINGASLLETEFGNGQTHHVFVINFQSPSSQEIERCHGPRNAGTEIDPHAMAHFLAMEHCREPRQHRFHQHPCVPGATRTDLHGGRIAALGMESRIRQDNHPAVKLGNQRVKMRVVDVGGGAVPGTHHAPLVQDEAELATNNPPMMALALLPNLGRAAPFPHGVDQRDPRGVRHAQHGGSSQKPCGPRRVRLEKPGQTGALRHVGKTTADRRASRRL